MDKRPIGVFDSGRGGLTAVRELRKVLPEEDIIYFGDTGRVPYGSRSREIILQYARQDIAFLLSKNVKYIMAACGTVSSILPADFSDRLPVPYTGVLEAAARAAAAATSNRRIGVIGTAATIRSGSYYRLLKQLLPDAEIFTRACPMFVPLVENGYLGRENPITTAIAEEYLADIRAAGVDVLILGCTHYPLIADVIGKVMGPGVTLIDPGRETADATRSALAARGLLGGQGGQARFFVSDSTEGFVAVADTFLGQYAGGPVERIDIDRYQLRLDQTGEGGRSIEL